MFKKVFNFSNLIFYSSIIFFLLYLFSLPYWPMSHDTTAIEHIAKLIYRDGYIPYKEIYDQSFPGTFLFFIFKEIFFGHSDMGAQSFNLLFCIVFFSVFIFMFKRNIKQLTPIILFFLTYFSFGAEMSLQRDFICAFFIIIAFLVTEFNWAKKYRIKYYLLGFIISFVCMMKPQLGIGLPILFFYTILKESDKRFKAIIINGLVVILGFATVLFFSFLWVYLKNGLDFYLFMQKNYLPLYVRLNKNHEYIPDITQRLLINIKAFIYLIPFWRGAFFVLFSGYCIAFLEKWNFKNNSRFYLFSFLAIFYSLILLLNGHYFPYHFMPFWFFSFLSFSYVFIDLKNTKSIQIKNFTLFVVFIINILFIPREFKSFYSNTPMPKVKKGRVEFLVEKFDEIKTNNNYVQPLDWMRGGVFHAMMKSGKLIASPFFDDHCLKQGMEQPHFKKLEEIFINSLETKKASLIVESLVHKSPKGPGTSNKISKKLLSYIKNNYSIINLDKNFIIYQRTSELK
jgi:hypothetical protein